MVLEQGVDLSAEPYGDIKRRSPLHTAAFSNEPRILALLIQHGADPCQVDHDGHYPSDLAARNARSAAIDDYLQARNIESVIRGHVSSALHLIWSNNSLIWDVFASVDEELSDERLRQDYCPSNYVLLGSL